MFGDDADIECEDLLIQRLIRQEIELDSYKTAYKNLADYYEQVWNTCSEIIDALPEPEVIDEIIEDYNGPYRGYLREVSTYFSNLKITTEEVKTRKTINNDNIK